ncbi:MAG: N-6 DNA methylase [Desulfobacterales bacterium]|nr:N-6 DNA methylase [Desulfobacterales bacterium]
MELKEGYIEDFISGLPVRATPEEVEAVQVYSKILVADYGYPKTHIQTKPQWRVKSRPSDTKKEYPIDIGVFSKSEHKEDNIQIIIECKKPNRKDGRTQLEDYLRFSIARIGVWFNGNEKLFLKKTESKGKIYFEEIPNIPKYGERLEDVGLYKRKDLLISHNLKSVFRTIRNYLAANAVGITRDEVFAQQIINLVFCKIYDERFTKPNDTVKFRAGLGEKAGKIRTRIQEIFDNVKKQYGDVIDSNDEILLDEKSLSYAVGELQLYCIIESERDAVADAFETFIGPSLKGGQGQFFTPRNVVRLLVNIVNPDIEDKIIDPACGSGGFLVEATRDIWKRIEYKGKSYNWPDSEVFSEKQKIAIKNIKGIDKDSFLSKVAKAYMAIIGDGRGGVFCENSLDDHQKWQNLAREHIQLSNFDVVITNPPFGKKLKIDDTKILSSFDLGHKWSLKKGNTLFEKQQKLHSGQAPQILFIERCLELLKEGGRLGIIAPESMFCNPSHRYIVQYIKSVARIKAIISLPEELFQPYTHAKTCAVVIEKTPTNHDNGHEIFMGIAKWCGHDSRGLPIPHDDLPRILEKYLEYKEKGELTYDHWGFIANEAKIQNNIYLPKYYNPELSRKLTTLKKTHDLLIFGEQVEQGVLSISSGHEVGKLAYGTGHIPFIRTSEIANWEIKLDPKHGLSEAIYEDYKEKQDVQENDILMVRDGTYLIGTCGIVTNLDTKIVYQSHIYKIRSNNPEILHPFLLLAVLTSPIVKEQIFSKRFTQDIIDTLGGRINELALPIPKDEKIKNDVIENVRSVLNHKNQARELTRETILGVAPITGQDNDNDFLTMSK